MKLPVLAESDLADLATPPGRADPAVVLRAARGAGEGRRRASRTGRARIVGEVIVGLVEGDSQSYLTQDPTWTPTYGTDGTFEMTDLLTTAGVVGSLPERIPGMRGVWNSGAVTDAPTG